MDRVSEHNQQEIERLSLHPIIDNHVFSYINDVEIEKISDINIRQQNSAEYCFK
jgi:hypothetical protein